MVEYNLNDCKITYEDGNSGTVTLNTRRYTDNILTDHNCQWITTTTWNPSDGWLGYASSGYSQAIEGNWKGNEDMLESYEILKVYKNRKEEVLKEKADKNIKNILDNLELQKRYTEIVNKFSAEMEEMYTSQFAEGQTESNTDRESLQIVLNLGESCKYLINKNFINDEIIEIKKQLEVDLIALETELEPVKALLKICKDKNEVEEVLKRYSILDKSGKINI